jgi:hypothetical protein
LLHPEFTAAYTYQRPDGNRFVAGKGSMPDTEPLDIPLSGEPLWLLAAPTNEGSLWVTVLQDGRVEAFRVVGEDVSPITITPPSVTPGAPAALVADQGRPRLLTAPNDDASTTTHAVRVPLPDALVAYVGGAGDLVFWGEEQVDRLAASILPDARLLIDPVGQLLVLTRPTTEYGHGVLGDGIEASGITLIDAAAPARAVLHIEIDPGRVIEGIAPIWTDLSGDGRREIIVTLSDPIHGAQVVAYDETGSLLARGPAIGTGYRWRHQLAVAPFGPDGGLELAAVRTPHIGGVVEFYRLNEDRLDIVAEVAGYSSHVLGSRNLDAGLAGDFDGDGRIELLVPDQRQENLGAIRRDADGASAAWSIPLGGRLTTNLAAVALPGEGLAVGAGHASHGLRIWLP